MARLTFLLPVLGALVCTAADLSHLPAKGTRSFWNVAALDVAPKTWSVDLPCSNNYGRVEGVEPIFIEGELLAGKPTRVFAWWGLPKGASKDAKVPAMVLVHGGGGTAFAKWVKTWNDRGYAAIAMDNCGGMPNGERDGRPHPRHPWSGPSGWGSSVAQIPQPLTDQWTYHAVAAVMRCHSFLRSRPEVDANRTGLTGISWGGYLTSIVAGVDDRFKFAVPVYGCGYYEMNPDWGHMNGDKQLLRTWYEVWDPKSYLPTAKIPVMWCAGTNDRWYPLDALRKSYELLPSTTPLSLALRLRMPHSHPPAGDPKEITAMADHFLKGAPALVEVTSAAMKDGRLAVAFDAHGRRVVKAELLATCEAKPRLMDRFWTATPVADFDPSHASFAAPVPKGAVMWFANVVTDDGLVASTRIFRPDDVCSAPRAPVEPSALFSDHALLLKSADTPVFGFAAPGARVDVSLGAASASGLADANGEWLVHLDLMNVGTGPFELKINDFVAKDVLVGEVWLCSGQSNMSFKMGSADDIDVESHVTNRLLRCFVVGGGAETAPNPRIRGRWLVNVPWETHAMTAVGYHFGKYLQQALKTPVGIVESAVGASTIEAWCDPVTMASAPEGSAILARQIAFMKKYRDYDDRCTAAIRDWEGKFGRADRPHGAAPKAGWRALSDKEKSSFGHAQGAFWLRRTVKATPGKGLAFSRRRFIEKQWFFDPSSVEVYWNGTRVARTFPDDPIEKNTECFNVPSASGEGTLEVRLFNAEWFRDVLYTFWLDGRRLDPEGWQIANEFTLPEMSAEARKAYPPRQRFCLRQHYPTGLHNGMIAGLVPMGLSGVVWYQGESNAAIAESSSGPEKYADLFQGFIRSWRRLFGKPELPFVWCQLANNATRTTNANEDSAWAMLRASQQKALALPKTGQAILIDVGEEYDIHPRDKRTPGARLAAWALNKVYGRNVPYRGPHAVSAWLEQGTAVVTFEDCAKGLVARDLGKKYIRRSRANEWGDVVRNSPNAQVEGFALQGADGVWRWADVATIVGDRVTVSSKQVPNPVAVRYGWATNPYVNLYNGDGLPAEPFARKLEMQ